MKAAVHNLGCKVNGYELDVMTQQLRAHGFEIVPFDTKADVYVINTCTVTNIADRKSRQMLHKAKKENPQALVVAVGCYVETDIARVEADSSVDLAVGTNCKNRIADLILEALQKRTASGMAGGSAMVARTDITDHPQFENMQLSQPGHSRAFVKIQDGCNQFCSYCIIPYARGRIRSRAPEEVIEEVKRLASEGIREIVVTGIHVCSYGKDKGQDPEEALLDLLRRLQLISGISRIRLGSLEPRIMTERFVNGIAGLSKMCPHFHLSLQSGCDSVLKRMNRHYTSEEYYESVERLRSAFDRPAITTDVIVGFPGETEEEFAQCRQFLEKVRFYEIHVFKYSMRHGTVAAGMKGQLTDAQKSVRSDVLLELTARQAAEYRRQFVGEPDELLIEEKIQVNDRDYYVGHTKRYVEGIIPAEQLTCESRNNAAGRLVRGIFTRMMEDTPYLLMEHCEFEQQGEIE